MVCSEACVNTVEECRQLEEVMCDSYPSVELYIMMNCLCLEHYWCPSANASNLKCKWAVTTERGERLARFKDTLITVAMLVGSECQSFSSPVCCDGVEAAAAHAEQHLLPPFLWNHPDKNRIVICIVNWREGQVSQHASLISDYDTGVLTVIQQQFHSPESSE